MQVVATEIEFPVQVRIGVNSGEVLVGAMRAGGDPTAMGDVVNTAQRLEKLGEPGHVVVGPATEFATRDAIALRAARPGRAPRTRRAGGRLPRARCPDPARAPARPAARAARRPRRRAHHPDESHEDGDEPRRAPISCCWSPTPESARAGSRASSARSRRASWAPSCSTASASPTETPTRSARSPNRCARPPRAKVRATTSDIEDPDRRQDQPSARPRHRAGRVRARRRRAAVPARGHLPTGCRSRPRARRGVALGARRARGARAEGSRSCSCSRTSTGRPTTRSSSANGSSIALRNLPFVLVATARPDIETRWTPEPGKYNGITLQLDPLDEAATGELVASLLDGDADPELVTLLLERSGGNPFFIEELVAFMQESGDTASIREVPATLHGLLAARLDALDPAERSLLEDCAVVGATGPIAAVLCLADRDDASALLDRLAERDLVELDDDEFHFKSDLIHEIAYGTLTKAERARRHARVAPALETRGEATIDAVAAPSRDRGRARGRARHRARRARRRARAGGRRARAGGRPRRARRVVGALRPPPRPSARPAPAGARARPLARAARTGQSLGRTSGTSTRPATTSSWCSPKQPTPASSARRPKR